MITTLLIICALSLTLHLVTFVFVVLVIWDSSGPPEHITGFASMDPPIGRDEASFK